jgi:enoyl-CoA hydratase/carnithine racemase
VTFHALSLETEGHVATLTLDRPSAGNAVDETMAFELREACAQVGRDGDVWVMLLTGSGDTFCRGTDLSSTPVDPTETLRVAGAVAGVQMPVIAALNGDATDQGLELALACDIRIASSGVRLGLTQVSHGTIPWDGGTQRLPRLIGPGRAMEMVLTSRLLDADECVEAGLVNELVDPSRLMDRARELASTVSSHGPIATRYLKEALQKGADMTLEQGLHLEADLNVILQSTADRTEGIRSFLERRKPEFKGE